jgi:hypothetical protein
MGICARPGADSLCPKGAGFASEPRIEGNRLGCAYALFVGTNRVFGFPMQGCKIQFELFASRG